MREILATLPWTPDSLHGRTEEQFIKVVQEAARVDGWVKVEMKHKRLLRSIIEHPFYSVTEHAENLDKMSPWQMKRTTEELQKISFLEEPIVLSLGRRGSPHTYIRISEAGARFIGADLKKCNYPGRGGFGCC